MNKSALLLCLIGSISLLNDGRPGHENAATFKSGMDKFPSEVRGGFFAGRASLPEDIESTGRDFKDLPTVAEGIWNRIRSRATVAVAELHQSVRHYSGNSADEP